MPKVKTNKSAAKRFKITGKGKVKRMRAFKRPSRATSSPRNPPSGNGACASRTWRRPEMRSASTGC
jgi:hypothetical protein